MESKSDKFIAFDKAISEIADDMSVAEVIVVVCWVVLFRTQSAINGNLFNSSTEALMALNKMGKLFMDAAKELEK